jgi:probable O-glycosylation ligase (exosortase A-associated)
MRDLFVTAVVFGLLPSCFMRSDIGLMVFCWLSYMNPHRLCYGFASTMPYAQLVALATLAGLLTSKEPKKIPWKAPVVLILVFLIWMLVTTVFAFYEEAAWIMFNQTWKIQLITFLITIIMTTKERINNLVWVMAMSLAFYGVKGGIFTITTGGSARVWGPASTFIGGNNEIGLALLMTLPLLRYLQLASNNLLIKRGMTAVIVLSILCILGTQSRGALVGFAAVILFLVLKSRNKVPLVLALAITIPAALSMMPESWYARMNTMKTYTKDGSAMGRINAWYTAVNIANHRIVGGGFKCLHLVETFRRYAPNPDDVHDAHSIFFQVIGEHGYIGLILFVAIGLTSWNLAAKTAKLARGDPEFNWMADLCNMIQVSFVGYASAGLFLGLATFDLFYNLVAVVVACNVLITKSRVKATVNEETSTAEKPQLRRAGNFVRPPIRSPETLARR